MSLAACDHPYDVILSGMKSPQWRKKMIHPLPEMPVVSREEALIAFATGKRVLDIGSSGPMAVGLRMVANGVYGLDHTLPYDFKEYLQFMVTDLDDVSAKDLPHFAGVERIICGEVIEHLSNPGWFLTRLRRQYPVPVIVTVPSAHNTRGVKWHLKGMECVNPDHIAWHSPITIGNLLHRAGYSTHNWRWYNGRPNDAEGLIVEAH